MLSGTEKLRENAPRKLSTRWNFSSLVSLFSLRSPLIVIIPSSSVTLTSSFLTAGSSARMRYSLPVSLMSALGAHSNLPPLSAETRGKCASRLGINRPNALSNSPKGCHLIRLMMIPHLVVSGRLSDASLARPSEWRDSQRRVVTYAITTLLCAHAARAVRIVMWATTPKCGTAVSPIRNTTDDSRPGSRETAGTTSRKSRSSHADCQCRARRSPGDLRPNRREWRRLHQLRGIRRPDTRNRQYAAGSRVARQLRGHRHES